MSQQLSLFGLPALERAGTSSSLRLNNPTLLMLYLANKGDWISRSELAFLFRPDDEESKALKIVRLLLYRAKKLDWVTDSLELERRKAKFSITTDTKLFKEAIAQQNWQEARRLYKKPFFAGFSSSELPTYNAWIEVERFDYEVIYRDALIAYSSALEAQGSYQGATEILGDLLELNPIAEDFMQDYLRNIYLSGQREKALVIYEQFCKQLAQEYDSLPLQETQALVEIIKNNQKLEAKAATQPKIITRTQTKTNLPAQSTHFIGRKADIKELNEQIKIPSCHLISIIGLGGSGKTRLAIELATKQQNSFADGIYFIDLSKLSKAHELNNQVAQALGLTLAPQQNSTEQIKSYLSDKESLLIFDNFEHILEAATTLQEYLEASSSIKILVTSRQRLNLSSEWIYDLEGLNYPKTEDKNNLEDYDAVSLFINSAKRVAPKLELTDDDIKTIAQITRQVQGLPLALELAASWCRLMSVDRICQELCESYDLLESQYSDVADKHKNMRAIWEQTWQRLSQKKRETLAKFTVFQGGGTLEAIEKVTNTHFSVLLSLVNESLLKRIPPDRFEMHELLKQFASSKLTYSLEEARNSHANTHVQMAAQLAPANKKLQPDFLAILDIDRYNFQAAWWHLIEENKYKQLEILQRPLKYLFFAKAYYNEGVEFYQKSIEKLISTKASKEKSFFIADIDAILADLLMPLGKWQEAIEQLNHGLNLLKNESAPIQRAELLESRSRIHYFKGEFVAAKENIQEAIKLLEHSPNKQTRANFIHALAIITTQLKDFKDAEKYYYKALEHYQEINDNSNMTLTLNNLASLKMRLGELHESKVLLEKALLLSQQFDSARAEMNITNTLSGVHYRLGGFAESEKYSIITIELCEKAKDNLYAIYAHLTLAKIKIKVASLDRVKTHLLDGLKLAYRLDSKIQYLEVILAYTQYLFAKKQYEPALPYLAVVLEHTEIQDYSIKEANELKVELDKSALNKLDSKIFKNANIRDLIDEINIQLQS